MRYLIIVLAIMVLVGGGCAKKTVESPSINQAPGAELTGTPSQMSDSDLESGMYQVVGSESRLGWYGAKRIGNSHEGTVDVIGGELSLSDDGSVSGTVAVDMNSITELPKDTGAIRHLKGEDFFSVDKYPTAAFSPKKIMKHNSDYHVEGELTIKGITNAISFPAMVEMSSDAVMVKAKFNIDRAKWDIRYGSESFFSDLGDNIINNEIEFDLSLKMMKK